MLQAEVSRNGGGSGMLCNKRKLARELPLDRDELRVREHITSCHCEVLVSVQVEREVGSN